MNDNISHLWSSHANIVARNRFKHEQQVFFSCTAILIIAGFVALLMACTIEEKQPVAKEQIVLPEAKRGEVDVITIYE